MLAVIFVPLERLFAAHPQKILRKQFGVDLGYYILNSLVLALVFSIPLGILAWAANKTIPVSVLTATASLPLWARLMLALVAGEIGYYWGHRLSHEIPFLWDFHSIHHSAENIDFLVNSRAHPVDLVFGRICGLVPIFALGLGGPLDSGGSMVPVLVAAFGLFWGFFIHANVRWRFGPLEWLISTPAFHHWHHTLSGPINRNYSSTLPWLDAIFGTLYIPRKELPSAYGIKAKVPDSLLGQLSFPLSSEAPSLQRPRVQADHSVDPVLSDERPFARPQVAASGPAEAGSLPLLPASDTK
jgi:sterol desaturase/sphingolipid hydroxylase (fatty acid hydroxylase superfamily)